MDTLNLLFFPLHTVQFLTQNGPYRELKQKKWLTMFSTDFMAIVNSHTDYVNWFSRIHQLEETHEDFLLGRPDAL